MDQRGALRLQPDRDARPGEKRAVVADERDVGRAAHADEARFGALLADAVADRGEDVGVREAVDRRTESVAERGADRDDDLVRTVARRRVTGLGHDRRRRVTVLDELARIDHVRQ